MVGILTFHNATNYGAILQTYALQKALIKEGINAEIIDYRCPAITAAHKIRMKGLNFVGFLIKKKTKKSFERFYENEIRHSKPIADIGSLYEYESIIVGSDQVWNMSLTENDYSFFLENAKVKKYSYAASIGDYSFTKKDIKERIKAALGKFEKISVREITTADYLKETLEGCSEKISVHPDPVLLLSKEEWMDVCDYKPRKDYILVYILGPKRKELIDKAREIAREQNLPVIWVSDSLRKYKGVRNIRNVSPEKFVGLLAQSSYIVTNSFHGTVFGVLFQKKMSVLGWNGRRMEDLLDFVGIKNEKENGFINIDERTDWAKVKEQIAKGASEAKEYLKSIQK